MICEKVVSKISFHDFGHYIFIAESLGGFLISITYFDKGISQIRGSDRLAQTAVGGPFRLGHWPRKLSCAVWIGCGQCGVSNALSFQLCGAIL
jgi:hypothetical protein